MIGNFILGLFSFIAVVNVFGGSFCLAVLVADGHYQAECAVERQARSILAELRTDPRLRRRCNL